MINNLLEKKFEGFSNLSDEECGRIIELYLLEGLESETLLEREMISKFLFFTYPGREPIRKNFNAAIKKNRQRIANLTIGEWLGRYIKTYEGKERTPNTFFEFVNSSPEIRALTKKDKIRLMRIFRMYDYLLVEPIFELDDIRMNILKFPMYLNEENPEMPSIQKDEYIPSMPKKIISTSLASALNSYPSAGEQLITSSPIKLKIFPSSVRPSVKNWIEDYRSTMGAQKHGMMERGNYLFHTENTRRLTSGERKKLAEVLRSLDEEVTLKVDSERQEIIFEQTEERKPVEKLEKMPNYQFPMSNQYQNPNVKNSNLEAPNKIPDTKYNIQNTNMRFSSPHTLPSERNGESLSRQAISQQPVFNKPLINPQAGRSWEPASTSQGRGEPKINGNIVDLKN
ncbi:MAG: hypothetical protein V1804_00770 [Patescibacteria group bacterium]